jgi:hypothetical protein
VLAANGLAAGLAASFGLGDRQTIQVDMTSRDRAVAAWLFERAMYRAREIDTNNPTPALGGRHESHPRHGRSPLRPPHQLDPRLPHHDTGSPDRQRYFKA